nr:hypothetical protein BaRGS_029607 [Batillaria attramentaria]
MKVRGSRKEDGEFAVPYEAELECKENIVVYDGKTKDLRDTEGGYEEFSRLYTFLRSEKVIFMPRRERGRSKGAAVKCLENRGDVVSDFRAGGSPSSRVLDLLKATDPCNWSKAVSDVFERSESVMTQQSFTTKPGRRGRKKMETNFYRIYMPDSNDAQIAKHFPRICDFLDTRIGKKAEPKQPVLVFDKVGFSLSGTIVMAYLMNARKADVDSAWKMVKKHLPTFRPNRGFVEQLSVWEITVCGATATDIGDPRF